MAEARFYPSLRPLLTKDQRRAIQTNRVVERALGEVVAALHAIYSAPKESDGETTPLQRQLAASEVEPAAFDQWVPLADFIRAYQQLGAPGSPLTFPRYGFVNARALLRGLRAHVELRTVSRVDQSDVEELRLRRQPLPKTINAVEEQAISRTQSVLEFLDDLFARLRDKYQSEWLLFADFEHEFQSQISPSHFGFRNVKDLVRSLPQISTRRYDPNCPPAWITDSRYSSSQSSSSQASSSTDRQSSSSSTDSQSSSTDSQSSSSDSQSSSSTSARGKKVFEVRLQLRKITNSLPQPIEVLPADEPESTSALLPEAPTRQEGFAPISTKRISARTKEHVFKLLHGLPFDTVIRLVEFRGDDELADVESGLQWLLSDDEDDSDDVRPAKRQRRLVEQTYTKTKHRPVLGFDLEWKPELSKEQENNIALMQLAAERKVLLIHTQGIWTPRLSMMLSSWMFAENGPYFCGVGMQEDLRKLRRHLNVTGEQFPERRFVDVRSHHNFRGTNLGEFGFDRLFAAFEGFSEARRLVPVAKSFKEKLQTTCSNWENCQLRYLQIAYAAFDAWGSRQLYLAASSLGHCTCPDCAALPRYAHHLSGLDQDIFAQCSICHVKIYAYDLEKAVNSHYQQNHPKSLVAPSSRPAASSTITDSTPPPVPARRQ